MSLKRWYTYIIDDAFASANEVINKLLKVSSEYDFIVQKIISTQTTSDMKIRIIDNEFQWSNGKVQLDNFAGDIDYPNILVEPIKIPKNTHIEAELTNGATATNPFQIAMHGYLITDMPQSNRRWFQYITDIAFTGASEQAIREIKVSSHNNLIINKFLAKATATDYQVDIIDANDKWTQQFTKGSNIMGSAKHPNVLLTPIVVPANSTITFQVINGATASNPVQLCLEGYLEKF